MTSHFRYSHHWIFGVAALTVWLALGWPFLQELMSGTARREVPVPLHWLVPYAIFGAAVLGAMVLKPRTSLQRILLCVQLAAVMAMAVVHPSDVMSIFLIVIAWQVAMATALAKALSWVAFQTLAVIGTLLLAGDPDLSYIIGLSVVLQLCFVFTAYTLQKEGEAARALTEANSELQSAQAMLADTVRDGERLRISRELHDAWGHELTALGLQLEIASNVNETDRANHHVVQAKSLARDLLAKVRNVVATLREAERGDTKDARARDERSAGSHPGATAFMAGHRKNQHWIFCLAALAVTLALGWPVLQMFIADPARVSAPWLVSFAVFGVAVFGAIALKPRPRFQWALLCVQLAAVAAMAVIASWAMMAAFLIVIAWQVAMLTGLVKALGWVAFQTLAVTAALALAPSPDLCWVIGKSFALQLCFVFMAQALRQEAQTARALAETNNELRAAQVIIANTARDAERLRIARELHDAWGHELIALGLQLEIASNIPERTRANTHVMQAKGLARDLLGNVRDVVATLHEAERCDLKDALESLAQSVPVPAIHVDFAQGVRVSPDQSHALVRCAQEAVTNAIKHAKASNLWLQVAADGDGVRLVAHNDGNARATASSPGSGLLGMRERVESLGGKLAVRTGFDFGFTVDAWLPSAKPHAT